MSDGTTYSPDLAVVNPNPTSTKEISSAEPRPIPTESLQDQTEKLIEEKLHPSIEEDQAGFSRKIFRYKEVSFSFRGKEELPQYPTFNNSMVKILGDQPQFTAPEAYAKYQERTSQTNADVSTGTHFSVTKSIHGVIDLALELGGEYTQLSQMREELKEGIYSSDTLALIDKLVACNFVRDMSIADTTSIDAEPIVVLSILGDTQATALVESYQQKLKEIDESDKAARWESPPKSEHDELTLNDLAVVHATSYKPTENGKNIYQVPTTFDATDGKILRNSIHFSLNHKVGTHSMGLVGNWSRTGYYLVSPMTDMMKANGNPSMLLHQDTWWTRNPGERLTIPNATLIAAAGDTGDQLITENNGLVQVKSEGFTKNDLRKLLELAEHEDSKEAFMKRFSRQLGDTIGDIHKDISKKTGKILDTDSSTLITGILEKSPYFKTDKSPDAVEKDIRMIIFGGRRNLTGFIRDWALETLTFSGLPQYLQETNPDIAPEMLNNLIDILGNNIEGWMYEELNTRAINEAIKNQDKKVLTDASDANPYYGTLAYQMELQQPSLHYNTTQAESEGRYAMAVNNAIHDDGQFDWTRFNPEFIEKRGVLYPKRHPGNELRNVDQSTRRVVYAGGHFVARSGKTSVNESTSIVDWKELLEQT